MGSTMGTGNVHDDDLETLQFADEGEDEDHCAHHSCFDESEYGQGDDHDCDDFDDYCCHCECCCTCLGCEYGPRDGMLMYPDGPAPWLAELEGTPGV